jgi:hypothetical protein
MEIQKVLRVNLNDFEKSELINLALHKHRIFIMTQIENNIYIHPDEKYEQYENLDFILYTMYNCLMLGYDESHIIDNLNNQGFMHSFKWFCEDYGIFQII